MELCGSPQQSNLLGSIRFGQHPTLLGPERDSSWDTLVASRLPPTPSGLGRVHGLRSPVSGSASDFCQFIYRVLLINILK